MSAVSGLLPVPSARGAGTGAGLLERIALALSSTLELKEVLLLLAEISLDASGAERTSVFLFDDGRLHPAAAVSRSTDEDMLHRFRAMDPIGLDVLQQHYLAAGRAVLIDDARDSDLVPREWADAFGLRGLTVVPLLASGEPCGLMAVEWPDGEDAGSSDLRLLEAIGAYAGVAVRNARVFDDTRRRGRLQAALAQSAATLASPLEPSVIAHRLVDAYSELLGARLCAIALLDGARDRITSVASRGTRPITGPIPLSEVPDRIVDGLWQAWTEAKRPVEMGDDPWLADYLGRGEDGAWWYLFVPLVVDEHSRGVVVLGFDEHTRLQDDERSAAEALADIAAAALERNELLGRLDRQLHRLETLYQASAGLNASATLPEALEVVCAAYEQLLGTSHCSVNLIDGARPQALRTLASRGVSWLAPDRQSLDAVAPEELARVAALWQEAPRPVVYDDVDDQEAVDPNLIPASVRSAALFPLVHGGTVFGVVVAGFRALGGPGDALGTGQALADLAAAAIDRGGLDDALRLRLRQVEALYRLSDVVAGDVDLDTVVGELSSLFAPEAGIALGTVSVATPEVRESVGARPPDDVELTAIRSWRSTLAKGTNGLRPRPVDDGLLIPVVHRNRVHGALPVTVTADRVDQTVEELLFAIGAGCAEVVYKSGLRRDLAERERRLAVAAERERIGRDLHDSVGQLLVGMGMRLNQYLDDAPDEVWRQRVEELVDLATRGSREVRQSISSLLFLDAQRHGLVPSLRELGQRFEVTTGIRMALEVEGRPQRLTAAVEDAMFRVAHEALMNVERHAAASSATLTVAYGSEHATLSVADDGVGLPSAPGDETKHFGLRAIEQRVHEVGGRLRLLDAEPHGAVVEMRVPAGPEISEEAGRAARARRPGR